MGSEKVHGVPIWRRLTAIVLFFCFIPLWIGLGGPALGISSFAIGWMLGIFYAGFTQKSGDNHANP